MASTHALPAPLAADLLWRKAGLVRSMALVVAATGLLTLSAKIEVPFWPVPITMQSLTVLLIGLAYGSRLGAVAVLAYLGEGLAGLPVFAGPVAGAGYMAGPTGGFLAGFVLAAFCVGWMAERGWDRSVLRASAALGVGHILLFIPGVLWLAVLLGWSKGIALGLTPFIFVTIVKTALGVALVAAFWSLLGNRLSAKAAQ
jgi:biotin transport system substrate-specific component